MTTTRNTSWVSTAQHVVNVADAKALDAYVAALPDDDRVAYYYANPAYQMLGYPAYLVHEADVLTKAGRIDDGAALLRDHSDAAWRADLEARRQANAPTSGQRVVAAVLMPVRTVVLGGCFTLAAYVGMGPHMAAGVATLTACFAGLVSLGGLISGGRE